MPRRFSTQFSKAKDGRPFFSPVMEDGAGLGDRSRPPWRKKMARVHGASAKSTCLTASAPTRSRTFSPIACSNPRATGKRRSAICSRKRRDKLGVAPRPAVFGVRRPRGHTSAHGPALRAVKAQTPRQKQSPAAFLVGFFDQGTPLSSTHAHPTARIRLL